MILKPLLLIAAILCSCALRAQVSELQLKNISRKDGLPSNESYCVCRDSKDYLWIGTDQGVIRFNGTKMERFNLPDNVIFKIREDEKGRIWFFSHSGMLAYYYNNTITPYKYNSAITEQLKGILITDARVVDDEIYINSYQYYNYKISKSGEIIPYKYFAQQESDLVINASRFADGYFAQKEIDNCTTSRSVILRIKKAGGQQEYTLPFNQRSLGQYGIIERGHSLYFFNSRSLMKLNDDGTSSCKVMPSEIICIGFGAGNNIWAGLSQMGAISLNEDLEEMPDDHILDKLSVSSICMDNEGGTWFCTLEKGIFYLQKNVMRRVDANGATGQPVFRVCKANDSVLLFASRKGIYKFSGGISNLIVPVTLFNATGFAAEGKNIYVCGSTNEITTGACGRNFHPDDPLFKNIFLFEGSSEIIKFNEAEIAFAVGTIFLRVTPAAYQDKKDVYGTDAFIFPRGFLFKDVAGRIWLGNLNSLYYLDAPFGVPKKAIPGSDLTDKGITAMRQMDNGLYALGIRFGGIALMKGNAIIASITEQEGLGSNSVKYLLVQGNTLWAATAKGISVIKFSSFEPLRYEITNIADDKNIYDIVIYQLVNFGGKIMAATAGGIYSFDPAGLLEKAPERIPFYINAVNTYKGDTANANVISLPFKHNRITVSFSAIAYNSFDDVEYYYRFANTDTAWQQIKTTDLLLENLSPGKYELELKCALPHQNRYSEIQKLEINILKPWWQSGIFIMACILFTLSILYIAYFFKIRKVKNAAKEKFAVKARMLELEHAALHAKMDPHFIFNCLTSIQQLVILGESAKANQYLVKFSRLIRSGLELSASNYTSISNEKSYIEEYLSLEQLRFPDIFDFSVHVESSISNGIAIPHMMIQPFVENSVRHGIRDLKNRRGSISIIFSRQGERIACTVMDNGIGISASMQKSASSGQRQSFGIDLVKKRLEIYNMQEEKIYFVQIENLHDNAGAAAGTLVTIYMPYKITHNA